VNRPPRRRALRRLAGGLAWPLLAGCHARDSLAGDAAPGLIGTPPKALALQGGKPIVWADWLGVNVQWQWTTPELMQIQGARLKALGLRWLRLGVHWMLAEPESGQWELSALDRTLAYTQAQGMPSLVYVVGSPRFASAAPAGAGYSDKFPPKDPAQLAQRMTQLAQRYPAVRAWQVWNEPNLAGFWQPNIDPAAYARLLEASSQSLRSLQPPRQVAAAGLAYFSEAPGQRALMIETLARAGAYAHGEIACYHPYTAEAEGAAGGARDLIDKMSFVNQGLRSLGVQTIWTTEWGWSSYDGPVEEQPLVGEDGQADRILKRLMMMATQDIDRSFLFALSDLDDNRIIQRDRSYGLLRSNGDPKPAYVALSRLFQLTGPRLRPLPPPAIEGGLPAGLVHMAWQRDDGRVIWLAWAHEAMSVAVPARPAGQWCSPLTGQRQAVAAGTALPVDTELRLFLSDAPLGP
jgi:beta-xylosidase